MSPMLAKFPEKKAFVSVMVKEETYATIVTYAKLHNQRISSVVEVLAEKLKLKMQREAREGQ